jgi:hypothetical protein
MRLEGFRYKVCVTIANTINQAIKKNHIKKRNKHDQFNSHPYPSWHFADCGLYLFGAVMLLISLFTNQTAACRGGPVEVSR